LRVPFKVRDKFGHVILGFVREFGDDFGKEKKGASERNRRL